MDDKNQKIAIIVTLLVVVIFFGGWYIFFGQIFSQGPSNLPLEQAQEIHSQFEPSGIVAPDIRTNANPDQATSTNVN